MMIRLPQLIGLLSIGTLWALTTATGPQQSSRTSASDEASPPDRNRRAEARLPIGMNLSSPTYYSAEMPFRDAFMLSSQWFHQNSNTTSPWDLGGLEVTNDGWPILQPGRGVACLMMRDLNGRYPRGTYVCTYTGTGEIAFGLDAHQIRGDPGRVIFEVLRPTDAGILFKIKWQDRENPIRNVHIWLPGMQPRPARLQSIFNPIFLRRLEPFSVLRFMDWQATNDSMLQTWSARTEVTDRTQAAAHGVAIEHMIDLCNGLRVDPWFCMPHQGDDDFIRRFAELVKARLEPDRRVYIEYSNEVWNPQFKQHGWVAQRADGANHPAKYAARAANAFSIWRDVFAGQEERLIRVAGCQQMNPWVAEVILDQLRGQVDALAPAFYFGVREHYDELEQLGADATARDVIQLAIKSLIERSIPKMREHAQLAARFGLDLITYEGGQHILPQPAGTTPLFSRAMWDAQRDSSMYEAYETLLESFRQMDGTLFVAFNFVGRQDSPWGSWGHLAYLTQPFAHAPKYRALVDHAAQSILRATP